MRSTTVKLTVMAFVVALFTGCKSGMPKWNWWSSDDNTVAPTTSLSGTPLPSHTAQPSLASGNNVGSTPPTYGSRPAYTAKGGPGYGASAYSNPTSYPNTSTYQAPGNYSKGSSYTNSGAYTGTAPYTSAGTRPNYSGSTQPAYTAKAGAPYGSNHGSAPTYGTGPYPTTNATSPVNVSRQPYGTGSNAYGPMPNYGASNGQAAPKAGYSTYNPTPGAKSPSTYLGTNNSYVRPPATNSTNLTPATGPYANNLSAAPKTSLSGGASATRPLGSTTYQPGAGAFGGNPPGNTGYRPAGTPTYQSPAPTYQSPGSSSAAGQAPQPYLPGSTAPYSSPTTPSAGGVAPATYRYPAGR
jgi:hypothetical protein